MRLPTRWTTVAAVALVLAASACTSGVTSDDGGSVARSTLETTATIDAVAAPDGAEPVTVPAPNGDRFLSGVADLDRAPVAVEVGGDLRSLVAVPTRDGGTLWVATRVTGEVVGFTLRDGIATAVEGLASATVTPDAAPLLVTDDAGTWRVLDLPEDASTISTPVPVGAGRIAYVSREGELRLARLEDGRPVDTVGTDVTDLLRDTRLTVTGDGGLVALAEPTDEYGHAVLGDGVEAASVVTIELASDLTGATVTDRATVRDLASGPVVEGTSVIVTDVEGDGEEDRLFTVSGPDEGAQVVALTSAGPILGEPIGRGGRWRHVIGVLPGPEGPEVVEVVTPHLGRRLQFLGATDGRLEVLAAQDGVSASHTIGSRNLDEAALVEVDGVGPAFVGPSVDRTELVVAHRVGDRVEVARTVALGAAWATNIAAVAHEDGTTALGVGLADGRVLVWDARA